MTLGNNGGVGMFMPVAPASGNYGYSVPSVPIMYGGSGNNFLGGGSDGLLGILFIIALLGGWGNGGFGNNGNGFEMQAGFNQAALSSSIGALQTSVTTGFSNAEVAACNRAMNEMQANYQTQIAAMQQGFNNTQSIDSRLDALSSQFAVCCCDNKAAVQDLKYTIATEAANTRSANEAIGRSLMDKLCQLEIDGVRNELEASRRDNAALQNQLNIADRNASQTAQTAQLAALINSKCGNPFGCPCNNVA